MTETRIGYKVVSLRKGRYCSITTFPGRVVYKVEEKAYPKIEGSKLFAFTTLEHASHFADRGHYGLPEGVKIFEAELENPMEPTSVLGFIYLSKGAIRKFWDYPPCHQVQAYSFLFKWRGSLLYSSCPFSGTLVCDSVTLLREAL